MTADLHHKTWPCMDCGEPIRVNPDAELGTPRYIHLDPVILTSHFAVRGPSKPRTENS